jgi:hypothetical protein
MIYIPSSQALRKIKSNDLPGCSENSQDTSILTTTLRQGSTRRFLFLVIALSTVAITVLSRQCLFCQPNFQPWRSHLFASPTLQDGFPLSTLETILQSEPSASCAADWSYYYTSQSYLPGQGEAQGLWTKKKWEDFGILETEVVKYNASINTPVFQRLALLDTSESLSPSVIYEAKLMEALLFNELSEIRTPAFYRQSSSSNVTAQFVFANFGHD